MDGTPREDLDRCVVVEGQGDLTEALAKAIGRVDPTCIIAASTPLAVQVLSLMKECGLRTPEDLAVAVFDGFAHGDLFIPSLTTVRQPAVEMGREAVEMLMTRIGGATDQRAGSRTVRLRHAVDWRASTEAWSPNRT